MTSLTASLGTSGRELWNTLAVVVLTLLGSAVVFRLLTMVRKMLWEPWKLRRIMMKQGVSGPPFRPIVGNLPEAAACAKKLPDNLPLTDQYDSVPSISPQYILWYPKFGNRFLYNWGSETRLAVRDVDFAKEVLITKAAAFGKSPANIFVSSQIVGKGLLTTEGEKWSAERRTLNPFFHTDSLKGMVSAMVDGVIGEIKEWERKVTEGGGSADFNLEPDIHKISGQIIAHTAFGHDYEKGRLVFENQQKWLQLFFKQFASPFFWIPGFKLIPTKLNLATRQLASEVDTVLKGVIQARRKAVESGGDCSYGDDLLGRMLSAAAEARFATDEKSPKFNLASVLNNCKLFYFAGQDTVANTTLFTLLLLARHPEWQDRVREEVLKVCGEEEVFNANVLNRLKVMGMVLNESMRIFIMVPRIARYCLKDVQIGDLFIPKGLCIEMSAQLMQMDPAYWGEDAAMFKPERWENGLSNACTHPQAFLPFSVGPKFCIGNNFAMMEVKIVIAVIIRRFQVLESPNYKHYPVYGFVQRPKFGMHLILKSLQSSTAWEEDQLCLRRRN